MYLEPWDLEIAEAVLQVKNPESIFVLSDEQAYAEYKEHRKWYDKLYIAREWSKIPTVSGNLIYKPRRNLEGMSKHCDYLSLDEMIIQERVEGRHLSIDWCINPKKNPSEEIIWQKYSVFQAHKDPENNSFYLFEALPTIDSWEVYSTIDLIVRQLIKEGYKGKFVNFEFIGPYLIEMHLRPSVQFIDIDGGLIRFGFRGGEISQQHEAYSYVFRSDNDQKLVNFKYIQNLPPGISSYQVCCERNKKLSDYTQDNFTFRKFVINGVNKEIILDFKKQLDKNSIWENA